MQAEKLDGSLEKQRNSIEAKRRRQETQFAAGGSFEIETD
jgi:hypothetical protein